MAIFHVQKLYLSDIYQLFLVVTSFMFQQLFSFECIFKDSDERALWLLKGYISYLSFSHKLLKYILYNTQGLKPNKHVF